MSEAVPGLLLALRENAALRKALWDGFSGPAIEMFAARGYGSESDARAALSVAAGAALFTTTVATDDDSPELQQRLVRLLSRALGVSPAE